MAPAYADFHWSLEKHLNTGGKARCEPVYNDSVKPDDNCNLNLEKLWKIAVDMDYTDMQIVGELCKEGLRNRSHVDGRSVLQCNYAGFYHHMIFNATKRAEKLSFQPPRLLGPFSAPPFIPFRVVPKNVVVQISDDGNGNIKWKYRATSDYGSTPTSSRRLSGPRFHAWLDKWRSCRHRGLNFRSSNRTSLASSRRYPEHMQTGSARYSLYLVKDWRSTHVGFSVTARCRRFPRE